MEHWPNVISIIQERFKEDAAPALAPSPSMTSLASASSRSLASRNSVREPTTPTFANMTSVPFRFHDRTAHSIYYLVRVDPMIIMVVIFSDRQTVKESGVVEFMASIAYSLRNGKVFEMLSRH